MKNAISYTTWIEALKFSDLIFDIDQNNVDACYGKVRSLIELQKFKEAKEIMSVLPKEILDEKKMQDLNLNVDVAENAFKA